MKFSGVRFKSVPSLVAWRVTGACPAAGGRAGGRRRQNQRMPMAMSLLGLLNMGTLPEEEELAEEGAVKGHEPAGLVSAGTDPARGQEGPTTWTLEGAALGKGEGDGGRGRSLGTARRDRGTGAQAAGANPLPRRLGSLAAAHASVQPAREICRIEHTVMASPY